MDLSPEQVRVLGALIEKEATTPDQYPLSSNALTNACNQKNNRDPLVSFTEREVDAIMLDLRALGLARTVHGAGMRTPKHKHVLEESWGLSPEQLAVLAVLLLRGPNTLTELRTRTERYVALPDLDATLGVVRSLEERDPPLVVELGRAPGQKETRFMHLACGEPDTAALASFASSAAHADRPVAGPGRSMTPVQELEAEVARVLAELESLRTRFDELCRRLGEEIPATAPTLVVPTAPAASAVDAGLPAGRGELEPLEAELGDDHARHE
jgi:uncharacterized protein YceH (UPF0502 family)